MIWNNLLVMVQPIFLHVLRLLIYFGFEDSVRGRLENRKIVGLLQSHSQQALEGT
jgi:hypothetical protein